MDAQKAHSMLWIFRIRHMQERIPRPAGGGYEGAWGCGYLCNRHCGFRIFKENRLEELEEALNIADEIIPKIPGIRLSGVVVNHKPPAI